LRYNDDKSLETSNFFNINKSSTISNIYIIDNEFYLMIMDFNAKAILTIAIAIIAIGFIGSSSSISDSVSYVHALAGGSSCSDAPYMPNCDNPSGGTGGHSDPGPIHAIRCNGQMMVIKKCPGV
jgi:hypothetical protein